MRTIVSASLVALFSAFFLAAPAQSAEDYGLSHSCKGMPNETRCEARRSDFKASLPLSLKGNRSAQSTVALCLRTGCNGAVALNTVSSCAWLLVIANSSGASVNDKLTLRDSCSPLSEAQKDAARLSAAQIYEKINKRQLLDFPTDI